MYQQQAIQDKGIGIVATKNIKLGTLILRETPQLFLDLDGDWTTEVIMEAFQKMNKEDKDLFMKLSNKFSIDKNLWSSNSIEYMDHINRTINLVKIPSENTVEICQLVNTNTFDNGVCLNISRLNHSCLANAEHFWNEDTNTRDVRAIKKIKKGEEICLNYQATISFLPRAVRQTNILKLFHFSCHCVACDLPEAEAVKLDKQCFRFKSHIKQWEKYKVLCEECDEKELESNSVKIVTLLKEMYQLAREMMIVSRLYIILEILNVGYILSFRYECKVDIKNFANTGFKLATIVFGQAHSETLIWKERGDIII